MPQPTTATDQFTRSNRLRTALARAVDVTEGRYLDYEQAEAMQRTSNAARVALAEASVRPHSRAERRAGSVSPAHK